MNMMATELPVPAKAKPRFAVFREFLQKSRKQVEIRALQVAEKVVRARSLRLLAVESLGACAVFHGIYLYSPRVAYIALGVGVILAAERQ